jgi:hypothetical protein
VENLPEISAIFQEQNPLAWPEDVLRTGFLAGRCDLDPFKIKRNAFHGMVTEVRQ